MTEVLSNYWSKKLDARSLVQTDVAKQVPHEFSRFMLNYRSALNEVMTRLSTLKSEFEHLHDYSPIEHVHSRLKSPESILHKAQRRGVPLTFEALSEEIFDIAGVRVITSFVSDAYWVAEMITTQPDVTLVEVKDYIAEPKPNGYKSLHLIIKVPIYLSESTHDVFVEVQIRTVAMEFWASLEHKIYYKYAQDIPENLLNELKDAASVASKLDSDMERIHHEVHPPQGARKRMQTPFNNGNSN